MAKPFYDRLNSYFAQVGAALRGEADAASIFPNSTDIGFSRERIYVDFLRNHLPSGCDVQLGGFLFSLDGQESKQIDVMVTADVCPQFNFINRDKQGKTFSCVDGTLAVASLKSNLDTTQLYDALDNLASIPSKTPLDGRVPPFLNLPDYPIWPFKIIYAPKGISLETLAKSLFIYYLEHRDIPETHRANLVHVAGQGCIIQQGAWRVLWDSTDVVGLLYAISNIQSVVVAARHILFNYHNLLNEITALLDSR
jgi:hypothetical protein